jgi:tRNA-dihydrouridine synthase A
MRSFDATPLSIAPMIQWTDRHWRYFMRLLTKQTLLYTEMLMDNAVIFNPEALELFLGHSNEEHPLALQLGGNDPASLSHAASLAERFGGFNEINLNCGCPSNKAKKAGFGAELMLDSDLVRQIVYEMKRKVANIEVTVKCRLGVTGKEAFEDLIDFIHAVKAGGVDKMIIHARSCVLKGLSPAQNRSIPPLHPELVHRIVKMFPDMKFILNGGITTFEQAQAHLQGFDDLPGVHGVMIGREAYNNPFLFSKADQTFFFNDTLDSPPTICMGRILEQYLDYATRQQALRARGSNTCSILKPLHNFFTHCHHNIDFKQALDIAIKQHSKAIDTGNMGLDELVWSCVDATMPKQLLWTEMRDVTKERRQLSA